MTAHDEVCSSDHPCKLYSEEQGGTPKTGGTGQIWRWDWAEVINQISQGSLWCHERPNQTFFSHMVAISITWKHTVICKSPSISISEPGWKTLECKVCLLTLYFPTLHLSLSTCILFIHRFLIVITWTHVGCLCASLNWFPTHPPAKSLPWSAAGLTDGRQSRRRRRYVSTLCVFQDPAAHGIRLSYSHTHTHIHTKSHMGTKGYNFPCCLF